MTLIRFLARKKPLSLAALILLSLFVIAAIIAPLLASSKPLILVWHGELYFPLFRYLLFKGFYTKPIDLFFNTFLFTLPVFALALYRPLKKVALVSASTLHFSLFIFSYFWGFQDPASDPLLNQKRQAYIKEHGSLNWNERLQFFTPYAKLNLLVHKQIETLQRDKYHYYLEKAGQKAEDNIEVPDSETWIQRNQWLEEEQKNISYSLMPLWRPHHWEEPTLGSEPLNQVLPWWELTRLAHKDLTSALLFGTRISLSVGFLAVGLSLLIGLPIGAIAGYFGGRTDLIVYRIIEIWEGCPSFFMLLFITAVMQSKSIFLIIFVLAIFGWTGFSRYSRAEVLKQKQLPYVEALLAMGFSWPRILFSHILPNAIPPILTLLPFAMMGSITAEAGLSFLGLGEERSCSWGVLMDEGRHAFPAQSYLLWPPALLLTLLLISMAILGDSLRDQLDPKTRK